MTEVNGHAREITALSMTETVVIERDGAEYESPMTNIPPASEQQRRPRPAREGTLDPRVPPKTIPPEHHHRTLVLCFDGTGDQFDGDNSNIVRLVSLLKKNDKSKQMVYYQSGIGTYTTPQIVTPIMSRVSKILDEMFAWNLDAHVRAGYEFLMQNYKEGDKICIFGFSRGAYTARSLAGMLHKVGLLPAGNYQQVPFAYKMYLRANSNGWEQSTAFKKTFSIDVNIEFLGVWDTVDSVGLIPKRLPFTTSNTIVRTFRHAISLDERRAKFKANLWNVPDENEEKLGFHAAEPASQPQTPTASRFLSDLPAVAKEIIAGRRHSDESKYPERESTEDRALDNLELKYAEKEDRKTNVEEVWFSGCHCDVGGGSVADKTRHSLSRIPLRWMIRECFRTNSGIMFDTEGLKSLGMDPMTLYPMVTPRPPALPVGLERIHEVPPPPPSKLKRLFSLRKKVEVAPEPPSPVGSEEQEDLKDTMAPVYDQLELKSFWWLLEILPLNLRYQNGENQWVSRIRCNFARPRFIPKQTARGVKVHRSVKTRMEAEYEGHKGKHYKPRAQFRVDPTWID